MSKKDFALSAPIPRSELVWGHPKLNSNEITVANYLLTRFGDGNTWTISIARISYDTKLSESTVKRALRKLRKLRKVGILKTEKAPSNRGLKVTYPHDNEHVEAERQRYKNELDRAIKALKSGQTDPTQSRVTQTLATNKVPGRVAVVVGGASVFEIVVVIRNQVAVDIVPFQKLGKGIIERFEGTPAALQEVESACVHVATCRHAWHAADEMAVKSDSACGQSIEVWRGVDATVATQCSQVERIEQQINASYNGNALAWLAAV